LDKERILQFIIDNPKGSPFMYELDIMQYFSDFNLIGTQKKEFISKTAFSTFQKHVNQIGSNIPILMTEESLF
jgi:hypothetical protein